MIPIALAGMACCLAGLFIYTRVQSALIAAKYPPRGSFVATPGGRLHYTEIVPQAPPRATVLLLHGASGSEADLMIPLGAALAARGFRVLGVDRPGLGWSDRPGGRADAEPGQQAARIRRALDSLGVAGVIVVGHSLAGLTACALALNHAKSVDGLVLLAPVSHPWPGGGVNWYYGVAAAPALGWLFTELVGLPGGLASVRQGLAGVFSPQATPDHYAERTGVPLVFRPPSFRANAQDVTMAYSATLRQAPLLGAVAAPTAIVTGDRDSVVLTKVHSFGCARDIPGAQLEILSGVGHSPHWSAPDKVVEAIDSVARRAGL